MRTIGTMIEVARLAIQLGDSAAALAALDRLSERLEPCRRLYEAVTSIELTARHTWLELPDGDDATACRELWGELNAALADHATHSEIITAWHADAVDPQRPAA